MRDQWYSDGRDLVKWGVLVHLARKYHLAKIIQVAYFRPHENAENNRSPIPKIELDGQAIQFPCEVWEHFRDIRLIKRLAKKVEIEIEVISTLWNRNGRRAYHENIKSLCANHQRPPILVFLDPDTGIAEDKNAKLEHVTKSEVSEIWSALTNSDWLVLYQHAFRKKDWDALKRKDFEGLTGKEIVKTFRATRGANDVVFYCVKKQ